MKVLFLLMMLAVSGCVGDVYIETTTVYSNKPSRAQKMFPRGESVLACTTMAALYDYLDNHREGMDIPAGCSYVPMTAIRDRGEYDSYRHGRVRIYQFQHGWDMYFTYKQSRGRRVVYY